MSVVNKSSPNIISYKSIVHTFANSFSEQFILHYQLPSTCHWCQKSPNHHLCCAYIVIDTIEILRLIFVVLLLLCLE